MLANINPYNESDFYQQFGSSDIAGLISKDFDQLSWHKNFRIPHYATPRQDIARPKFFSMVPLYYIEKLLEIPYDHIYDLGCGWNAFKRYIPNLIGVSPDVGRHFYGDHCDFVDQDYIQGHQNWFDAVFAINSLHYRPLEEIRQIVTDFISMVKSNGRGFLALNLARLVERSNQDFLISQFGTLEFDKSAYEEYIRKELGSITGIDWIIVDVDFQDEIDDVYDGNIRLVFKRI